MSGIQPLHVRLSGFADHLSYCLNGTFRMENTSRKFWQGLRDALREAETTLATMPCTACKGTGKLKGVDYSHPGEEYHYTEICQLCKGAPTTLTARLRVDGDALPDWVKGKTAAQATINGITITAESSDGWADVAWLVLGNFPDTAAHKGIHISVEDAELCAQHFAEHNKAPWPDLANRINEAIARNKGGTYGT